MHLPHLETRGRLSTDVARIPRASAQSFARRDEPQGSWRILEVHRKNLLNLPIAKLTEIALDLSPQVGKGLYDFLRFCNPGWVLEVENSSAKVILDDFIFDLEVLHGSFDALLDRMFASIFMGGAYFMELVFSRNADRATNIAVLDPISARYRRRSLPDLGQYWQLGQQGTSPDDFVVLQGNPFIKYVPIDTLPDKPYGRPLVTPAVYASIFMLGLIQDLRRVVANQGLRRSDYSVDSEKLTALIQRLQPEIINDPEASSSFIEHHLDEIKNALENLAPESAYVHLNTVDVSHADGSVSGQVMSGLDTLVRSLERQITIGLKSVPILMSSNESTAETHANRQLDFYLGAIESIQDELASVLSGFFGFVLQVAGRNDPFRFAFKKQRVIDRKTVAETQRIQIENVVTKRTNEFITQDQAVAEIKALSDPLQIG